MSYCSHCALQEENDWNRKYHDTLYGFPLDSDDELFGRFILEINQAGLSWLTILKKEANFRKAFDNYSIEKIANYDEVKINELLNNEGIIRNRLKVNAVIYNAKQIVRLKEDHKSFKNWLDCSIFETKEEAVKIFKKEFKFVGGEIVNEFLMSTGYLKGAHEETCSIYPKVLALNPTWMNREKEITTRLK